MWAAREKSEGARKKIFRSSPHLQDASDTTGWDFLIVHL